MKHAAVSAIAILLPWLWISFVAPAIGRAFGVPMVSGWRLIQQNQHLGRVVYVWCVGVLAVGLGLFFFLTVRQYAYCRFVVGRPINFGGSHIVLRLMICLAVGWFFGLYTAPAHEISDFPIH